jgi:hypothetical protein
LHFDVQIWCKMLRIVFQSELFDHKCWWIRHKEALQFFCKFPRSFVLEKNLNFITQVHIETKHGSGFNPFHNTIINSTFEVCKFLNETENNVVAKWVVNSLSESIPVDLIHPCPYFGHLRIWT